MSKIRGGRSRSREPLDRLDGMGGGMPIDGRSVLEDDWDQLLNFRSFVIDQVPEEATPTDAVTRYDDYFRRFRRSFVQNAFQRFVMDPQPSALLLERYSVELLLRQRVDDADHAFEATPQIAPLLANIQQPVLLESTERSLDSCMHAEPIRASVAAAEPLAFFTPPVYSVSDPDSTSLRLQHVPAAVSKWDFIDHIKQSPFKDQVLSVSCVAGPDVELQYKARPIARTAYIQVRDVKARDAVEQALEGAVVKGYTCRPQKCVPQPSTYTVAVTPVEACFIARMKRDLIISARLIVKFDGAAQDAAAASGTEDKSSNTSEGAGPDEAGKQVPDGSSDDVTVEKVLKVPDFAEQRAAEPDLSRFLSYCASHPILSSLESSLESSDDRVIATQLDRQILYLFFVHKMCYYAGRRFSSLREIWMTVGVQFVRPQVSLSNGSISSSDKFEFSSSDENYMYARDIIRPKVELKDGDDDVVMEPSLDAIAAAASDCALPEFKPLPTVSLPDEEEERPVRAMMIPSLESGSHGGSTTDRSPGSGRVRSEESLTLVLKKEEEEEESGSSSDKDKKRGQQSGWLRALDERLARLLGAAAYPRAEDVPREDSTEFQAHWLRHCQRMMSEAEPGKWRCEICKKMFRGAGFVLKHMKNKHFAEEGPKVLKQVGLRQMWAAYVGDLDRPIIAIPSPTPLRGRRRESPLMRHSCPSGRQYFDFDAPPQEVSNIAETGNLREIVNYGDL